MVFTQQHGIGKDSGNAGSTTSNSLLYGALPTNKQHALSAIPLRDELRVRAFDCAVRPQPYRQPTSVPFAR